MNFIKYSLVFSFLILTNQLTSAQVSVPERRPIAFSVRGGMVSNNGDLAASLRKKTDYNDAWRINTYYAGALEAVLGIDLIRLRKTDIVLHISALGAEPEIRAKSPTGEHRIANSQLGLARASLTFSFNNDNYKMFGMPWHTNHEAILGITGSFMYATNFELTNFAKDTLGLASIRGDRAVKSIGVIFGWNWRIADSGWIIGLTGSMLWFADAIPLLELKTGEATLYENDKLTYAPRILQFGIGYHF